MKAHVSLVCFVKTPGFTPFKTRLARTSTRELADEFYLASLAIVRELFDTLKSEGIRPVFAVSEKECLSHELWEGYETVWQGEGENGLGDRLAQVDAKVSRDSEKVLFMGADSPAVRACHILSAIKSLDKHEYCLGPTEDGGFWIYGGTKQLPSSVWNSVPYSVENTAATLLERLKEIGSASLLEKMRDVDVAEDLLFLYGDFSERESSLSAAQQKMRKLLSKHKQHFNNANL